MPPSELSTLAAPPSAADFTPLSDHQAQTPTTFFGGKPVLHAEFSDCALLIRQRDLAREEFKGFAPEPTSNGDGVDGASEGGVETMKVVTGIKGFVTSESLILIPTSTTQSRATLSIPYPAISLHATQRLLTSDTSPPSYYALTSTPSTGTSTTETQAIYLQVSPSDPAFRDPATDEDESETIELLLVPHSGDANAEKVKDIFEALSRCADLHPDAGMLGGDDEGEEMDEMGAGGWITSENMHEFEGQFGVDEDVEVNGEEGEGVVEGGLGEGAGRRRPREEVDGGDAGGEGDDETKWQRTE